MKIKLLSHGKMPTRAHATDAGYDIYLPEDVTFWPGSTEVINTGVCVQIPHGCAGMFVVRSSVSKTGLIIQPPLIDEGYTGELHIIAVNPLGQKLQYKAGDRICSLVVFPVVTEDLEQVEELDASERGTNWSGSSGK